MRTLLILFPVGVALFIFFHFLGRSAAQEVEARRQLQQDRWNHFQEWKNRCLESGGYPQAGLKDRVGMTEYYCIREGKSIAI